MDRKIRLLAACSVAALTTVACAPNGGTYAPHTQQAQAYTGSTTAAVTHSHSGKVHSHPLPATGIRHTHTMGGNNTVPVATQQQPAGNYTGNYNGGVTHSHSGRTHSHKLPASGLNHTHRVGAAAGGQVPQANYTPPVATNNQNQRRCWHGQNARGECNPAPQQNTYTPPVQNPGYNVPANTNGAVTHSHNGRTHSHRLPASGTNHTHSAGAAQPQNNGASYYDNYSGTGTTYTPPANNSNNSYYDYSDQGSNSSYYDTARPKGSDNYSTYQPEPKPTTNTGSFAPQSYSGSNVYVVKRGDTVFQVMRNTGVYWKDIIRMNNLQAPNYQINPGQRLRLR
ncbi:MAG: LysM peptidoglycan-binding domain-containing protein [Thiolinea sp.]